MTLKEEFEKINKNSNIVSCQETQKLIKKVVNFGYDTREAILQDLYEEIEELKDELLVGNIDRIKEEIGDVIFVLCNLGNQYNINIEDSLEYSTKEFQRRFNYIEEKVGSEELKNTKMSDIVKFWKEAKIK